MVEFLHDRLAREYGLERLIEQNDLSEADVIEALLQTGNIMPEDYVFENVDQLTLALED